MRATPLAFNCPSCGSADVVYSCEPDCCFNHVCGNCLASYQIATREIGGQVSGFSRSSAERDSLTPTAACAKCGRLNVSLLEGEGVEGANVVCVDCGSLLELVITQ